MAVPANQDAIAEAVKSFGLDKSVIKEYFTTEKSLDEKLSDVEKELAEVKQTVARLTKKLEETEKNLVELPDNVVELPNV